MRLLVMPDYRERPRCSACHQTLPRGEVKKRAVVRLMRDDSKTCVYALEQRYKVKRMNGGFV